MFNRFVSLFLPLLLLLFSIPTSVLSVKPGDAIILPNLGTYYLKNETFIFQLKPTSQVPLNTVIHTIYTATSAAVSTISKRMLFDQRRRLLEFSEEDHQLIKRWLYDDDETKVPPFVRVDRKKRSLESFDGVGAIRLTDEGLYFIHYEVKEELVTGKKRSEQVPYGSEFCVHSAFTMCPNDGGTESVRNAIKASTDEMRAELDDFKNTNELRDQNLQQVLMTQQTLISQFLQVQGVITTYVDDIAEQCSVNVGNAAYGDMVAQAQINYLKRVTNSLLRFMNALSSTDSRQVVAQPSMSALFSSFLSVQNFLLSKNFIPIVDQWNFTWNDKPLPQNTVSNVVQSPDNQLVTIFSYPAFTVLLSYYCGTNPCSNKQVKQDLITGYAQYGLFFGPIPFNMPGLYKVIPKDVVTDPIIVVLNSLSAVDDQSYSMNDSISTNFSCVQFGPYKGLANFTSTSQMINGIVGSDQLDISECNEYRLKDTRQVSNIIYTMFAVYEGVLIPFYSNCSGLDLFKLGLFSTVTVVGYPSTFPYGYYSHNDSTVVTDLVMIGLWIVNSSFTLSPIDTDIFTHYDMYEYHIISPNCHININPEWLGWSYYFSPILPSISQIPTGFKLSQFTINPAGELSSSLTFVYTTKWVNVYTIQLTSDNRIIPDEIDALNLNTVLFTNENYTIIDESNDFYGIGNSGRDCIVRAANYEYDTTNCIYQNNLVSYSADNYFRGLVPTSGVARYVNKFKYSFRFSGITQQVILVPMEDADFNFYLQTDGTVCPKLTNRVANEEGCQFNFYYTGKDVVNLNDVMDDTNTMQLDFNNMSATVWTKFGDYKMIVNSVVECLAVSCRYSVTYGTIKFEPPSFSIISASDLSLKTKVFNYADQLVDGALTTLQNVSQISFNLSTTFDNLHDAYKKLDFNFTGKLPYEDFSQMRKKVDQIIDQISSNPNTFNWDTDSCSSVFGSVSCFFKELGSVLLVIGIILLAALGIYFLCFKLKVYKALQLHK